METKDSNLILSGIEPVDELLGGLESGQLYLVHGDSAGKSLFGIKFLIEGLKRGENGSLVIRYSPEDAVRRFARLGYDCLEDIYSGRLVILEYTNDIIQQIARLEEITPVLRELEWLLGETRPQRVIFDPVAHMVLSERGDIERRVRAFADWAISFGSTVVLIANGDGSGVIQHFTPLVKESFRFEVKEDEERATRYFIFEKSNNIPDQPIEVDPSRGVFLLGRAQMPGQFATRFHPPAAADITIETLPIIEARPQAESDVESEPVVEAEPASPVLAEVETEPEESEKEKLLDETDKPLAATDAEASGADADMDTSQVTRPLIPPPGLRRQSTLNTNPTEAPQEETASQLPAPSSPNEVIEWQEDLLSELLDDLAGIPSPVDLESDDFQPIPTEKVKAEKAKEEAGAWMPASLEEPREEEDFQPPAETELQPAPQPTPVHTEPSKNESPITSRAVEALLRPPDTEPEASIAGAASFSYEENRIPVGINTKDFNVLVIDDDPASCSLMTQELSDYTVEIVHDGVAGLAKLISFKPDLVILDVDLPILDGFRILAHIRSSLNMPVIILSGTHMRASDRVLAAELGADYYMTKPFSVKEMRQKARHLIARYRGINSWIITSPTSQEAQIVPPIQEKIEPESARPTEKAEMALRFKPYRDFVLLVEDNVRHAIDSGASFSIVGCRLKNMTAGGGRPAMHLLDMVSKLVRETDLLSTNPRNDLVIFLAEADVAGAQAFAGRLRERVLEEMNQEPSVWMRSFPDIEEADQPTRPTYVPSNGNLNRRASDVKISENDLTEKGEDHSEKSLTDFLDKL